MGWSSKSEKTSWLLIAIIPLIGLFSGILVPFIPFIHRHPVIFWVSYTTLIAAGFIIVLNRGQRKENSKKEY